MNTMTPVAVGKRSLYMTIIAFANIILFSAFGFIGARAVLSTVGNGSGASDSVKYLIALAVFLFCILFALLGYLLLRLSQPIFYYDEGFQIGKKGELVPYKDLQYHFSPGRRPNRFILIFYKVGGKMKRISAQSYSADAFKPLQEAVVNANFQTMLKEIEGGQTVEFKAVKPSMMGASVKNLDNHLDNGIHVRINSSSISFNEEVYPWSEFQVLSPNVGEIVVLDPATQKRILNISTNHLIEQPNLVTALINVFGAK